MKVSWYHRKIKWKWPLFTNWIAIGAWNAGKSGFTEVFLSFALHLSTNMGENVHKNLNRTSNSYLNISIQNKWPTDCLISIKMHYKCMTCMSPHHLDAEVHRCAHVFNTWIEVSRLLFVEEVSPLMQKFFSPKGVLSEYFQFCTTKTPITSQVVEESLYSGSLTDSNWNLLILCTKQLLSAT